MESTYKGDSPNKKMARAYGWMNATYVLNFLDVSPLGAVVLAGHGGDIQTLDAASRMFNPVMISKPPRFMRHHTTAIDTDPDCVSHCVEEYECSGLVGKAEDHFHALKYNMTHMDFCSQIGADNIHTVVEAIVNATGPSYHLVTVLKGREQNNQSCTNEKLLKRIKETTSRQERRNLINKVGKQVLFGKSASSLFKRGKIDVKKGLQEIEVGVDKFLLRQDPEWKTLYKKKSGRLTAFGSTLIRGLYLEAMLKLVLDKTHHIDLVFGCYYQSNTEKNKGVPLITLGFMALPWESVCERRLAKLRALETCAWHFTQGISTFGTTEGDIELKKWVIDSERHVGLELTSKLYNVDPLSIAAWKAHATRGTYGKELAEYMANPKMGIGDLLANRDRYYK